MVILGHNLGNSQVSVYRTIGPTLVIVSKNHEVVDLCLQPCRVAVMGVLTLVLLESKKW